MAEPIHSVPDFEVVVLSTPGYRNHLDAFLHSYRQCFGCSVRLTVVHSSGPLTLAPEKVAGLDVQFRVEENRMLGCGAAREFARSSTSARWVLYTDCDVLFPAGFAAALGRDLALLDRAGFRAAQLNFDALEPSRWGEFEFSMDKQVILNRLDRDRNGEWWRAEGDEAFDGDCEKISCIRCMQGFGMLIQRELLDQIGGFDPALDSGEDRDVAARIVAADERIAFLPRLAISHSYDFDLVRIARRKWWHGKFSALTSEKHPKLYRGSMGSCFRMLASAMTPPKCFRSPRGRVYFAVQAVSFAASHILHAALLKLRGNRGSPGSAARQFKGL